MDVHRAKTDGPTLKADVISEKKAVNIATNDAGGFLGTWVTATLRENEWHIESTSKSTKAPMYYISESYLVSNKRVHAMPKMSKRRSQFYKRFLINSINITIKN